MIYLPVEKLKPGMVLARNAQIFYPTEVMLLGKGQMLTDKYIARLRLFDLGGAYIDDGLTDDVVPAPSVVEPKVKNLAITGTRAVFQRMTELKVERRDVGRLQEAVTQIVDNVLEHQELLVNISDLKSYDEYTYHHCLSVSILSVAVGLEIGLPKGMLVQLGLSALLHDIGKMLVPLDILNKPSSLTMDEYSLIKRHAFEGTEYLRENHLVDEMVCSGVRSHHEKLDGTGYPDGLVKDQIPLFGKIIAIADVYDALTSQRPYRAPLPPVEAAEFLMGNCNTSFDFDLVTAFLNRVDFYPVGSVVELSNGKSYVVVDNSNRLRPIVRSLSDPGEVLDLYHDRKTLDLVIQKN